MALGGVAGYWLVFQNWNLYREQQFYNISFCIKLSCFSRTNFNPGRERGDTSNNVGKKSTRREPTLITNVKCAIQHRRLPSGVAHSCLIDERERRKWYINTTINDGMSNRRTTMDNNNNNWNWQKAVVETRATHIKLPGQLNTAWKRPGINDVIMGRWTSLCPWEYTWSSWGREKFSSRSWRGRGGTAPKKKTTWGWGMHVWRDCKSSKNKQLTCMPCKPALLLRRRHRSTEDW